MAPPETGLRTAGPHSLGPSLLAASSARPGPVRRRPLVGTRSPVLGGAWGWTGEQAEGPAGVTAIGAGLEGAESRALAGGGAPGGLGGAPGGVLVGVVGVAGACTEGLTGGAEGHVGSLGHAGGLGWPL